MAFSAPSYFAGIGTVVAAIGLGFACGAMITGNVVQPPNRLERLNSAAKDPPKAGTPSNQEQASTAKPAAQDAPSPVVAAVPSPAVNSQPAPQPQAQPALVKTGATTQEQSASAPTTASPSSAPVARSEDTAKNERSADSNRETSRKKADMRKSWDNRKLSERRRRHDQDERRQAEAADVVRQAPRGYPLEEIVEPEAAPRSRMRPREMFGDDRPRMVDAPPPRFGFFGD